MPSMTHNGLLQPFEHQPELAADLLTGTFGLKLPAWRQARLTAADLTQPLPVEFRADMAIAFYDGDQPVLAVIVEVQLRKTDTKPYSWPVYVATLRARLRCPVVLLVVCPTVATARWAGQPIELGTDSVVTPLALGPGQVPVVTDPGQASRNPELAVLSAITHGRRKKHRPDVLRALLAALAAVEPVDQERAAIYHDVVSAALPRAARRYLENLMSTSTYQFQSEWHVSRIKQGLAQGKAEDVLAVLETRGIKVPQPARDQITDCTDVEQLDAWLRRAVTADSIRDVLGR